MTLVDFENELTVLAARIQNAGPNRHKFLPALSDMIAKTRKMGQPVAYRFFSLEKQLIEEAVESQFENMPV